MQLYTARTMFRRSWIIKKTFECASTKVSHQQNCRLIHQATIRNPVEIGLLPTCRPLPIPALACRKANMHDKDKIVEFLCYMFLNREPLMKVLNATIADAKPFVDYHVKTALRDDASFVAVDSAGQICAIRLNEVGPAPKDEHKLDFGPKMNTLSRFLHHVEGDICGRLGTTKFMRHIAICVKPSMVQGGVGTTLMQKSVDYVQCHGLQHMVAMCSGEVAYKLALKMGFKVVREVPYHTYVDNGKEMHGQYPDNTIINPQFKPFDTLTNPGYSARLMVRNALDGR